MYCRSDEEEEGESIAESKGDYLTYSSGKEANNDAHHLVVRNDLMRGELQFL